MVMSKLLSLSVLLFSTQVLAQQQNATAVITDLIASYPSFSAFSAAIGSNNASSVVLGTIIAQTVGCQAVNINTIQYSQTLLNYANQRRSILAPTLLLPICTSTCQAGEASINSILNNPESCQPPTTQQKDFRDLVQSDLAATCALSQSTNCFNGTLAESQTCGFSGPNAFKTAQVFCLNNLNICCASLTNTTTPTSTPTPTGATDPSSSTASYVIDWRVILAIVVGCLLLILLLILVLVLCIKRNRKEKEQLPQHVIMPLANQSPTDAAQSRQVYRVRHSYQADMSDEMDLKVDQQVLVDTHFPDGWAEGRNLTTGQVGMLPFSCLEATGVETGFGMRTSSILLENQKKYDAKDEPTLDEK